MRITFNLQGTGAANNGGTATLFHTANMLHELGHQVYVVSDKVNYFTWFELKGPQFIKCGTCEYPKADILVATGVSSIKHVLRAKDDKGVKYWWVRAHETWIADENFVFGCYRNRDLRVMVNSLCLQKFLEKKMGKTFPIVRPGTDVDFFKPSRKRNWSNKKSWVLGALYNEKPRKRFKWVPEIFMGLRERKLKVKLWLFGDDEKPKTVEHTRYFQQPDPEKLREFYNGVDLWLAPTKSEGLHMPPQEAMLCGCVLFGADEELSGMVDYLEDNETGVVIKDWPEAIQKIADLVSSDDGRMMLAYMSENGRKKIVELGDRRTNVRKMVSLFQEGRSDHNHRTRALMARGMRV